MALEDSFFGDALYFPSKMYSSLKIGVHCTYFPIHFEKRYSVCLEKGSEYFGSAVCAKIQLFHRTLRVVSTVWVTSIYLVISSFNLIGLFLPRSADFLWLVYKVCIQSYFMQMRLTHILCAYVYIYYYYENMLTLVLKT